MLADLSSGETLNIVDVTPVEFSGGYGYRITPGARAEVAKKNAIQFLAKHGKDIDWLFSTFGNLNSAELELASTIVYVDRELLERHQRASIDVVTQQVHDIKPHFTRQQVSRFIEDLIDEEVLEATTTPIARRA